MNDDQYTIMPLQPYVVLQSQNYRRIPHKELGISHFYQFTVTEGKGNSIYSVPDGSIDILFNIGKKEVHTYMSGTVFHAKPWEMGEEHTCFGVRFQAGQGILPKEMSIDMLVDQDVKIDEDLFGDQLAERIALAGNMEERTEIFKAAYHKIAMENADTSLQYNIDTYIRKRICQTKGNIPMEMLAKETGYTPCYIRRIFKKYHGISPKQFAQFVRFQHLLGVLKDENAHYEELALDCGYYDESHMMKDFKCYTGVTMDHYCSMIADKKEII